MNYVCAIYAVFITIVSAWLAYRNARLDDEVDFLRDRLDEANEDAEFNCSLMSDIIDKTRAYEQHEAESKRDEDDIRGNDYWG
jgi:hypothetical protein